MSHSITEKLTNICFGNLKIFFAILTIQAEDSSLAKSYNAYWGVCLLHTCNRADIVKKLDNEWKKY
jgi:hypothetical protein